LATEPYAHRVLRYGTMGKLVKFSLLQKRCRWVRQSRIRRSCLGIGREHPTASILSVSRG